ncbi:MAG: ABC transporter permease [Neisseria sp.]|nr:ABC transporter permease [Neisseria sp.]
MRAFRSLFTIYRLCGKEIRSLLGDTTMVVMLIMVFTVVPHIIHKGLRAEVRNATVAVIDDDRSELSYRLRGALVPPYFKPATTIERAQADQAMMRGEYIFILDIPPNFQKDLMAGQNPRIQLAVDATAMTQAAVGTSYIEQIFMRETADFFKIHSLAAAQPVDNVIHIQYNPNADSSWYNTVMQIVLNTTLLGLVLVGAAVIREREHGTIEHLLVMPVSAIEIALAKIIANGGVILLAAVLGMYFVVHLWIGIPLLGSLWLFALTAGIYLFTVTSLGMLAATLAPSMPQLGLLITPIIMISHQTSGGVTSVDSMPPAVQNWVQLNPATHFVAATRDIIFHGAGMETVWHKLLILAVMGVIFLTLALLRFRKMLEQQG